ncbi:hypothetical protein H4R34_002876 [Dimargaris verticillata]|uniref:Calcineurin-like phosphoesterase domain-containing protein n=1 Tax=Dimargaris verticillata TaxID=2761393 RepID=A0A9W8B807_9FUNG|nr:hypothetical protein H4R34_002876 [Dimargaris verticillata]
MVLSSLPGAKALLLGSLWAFCVLPGLGSDARRMRFTRRGGDLSGGIDAVVQKVRESILPELYTAPKEFNSKKRFIIVGDIHGAAKEFDDILKQVNFSAENGDQVILAGDMTVKGPDSNEVLKKAMEIKAACVRGNQDHRVVAAQYMLDNPDILQEFDLLSVGAKLPDGLQVKAKQLEVAQNMPAEDMAYLKACPAMVQLPAKYRMAVMHAGVEPSKPLSKQDPEWVMNIRNVLDNGEPSSEKDDGVGWFTLYNELKAGKGGNKGDSTEKTCGKPGGKPSGSLDQVVDHIVYGHDAGRGLNQLEFTHGLDSGCVYGRQLSALIMPGFELVQVPCKMYEEKVE